MKNIKHSFFYLIGVLVFIVPARNGYAINSPQIRCIAVTDSAGDVTVTWIIPSDTDNTFLSYNIYSAINKAGPYTLSATVTNKKQSSVTITGLPANATSVYFYAVTDTVGGASVPMDTLQSIYLILTNIPGVAKLSWNPIHNPNLATSTGWYKIYREHPKNVWSLVDSTKGLSYNDTIYICHAYLDYRIEIEDSSGCTSVSNIEGSTFTNTNVPETPSLDTVSVNGATNGVYVSWTKSSTKDVEGYIIYKYIGGIRTPIDTVYNIDSLRYYDNTTTAGTGSQSYWVAALDSCGNTSPYSNVQNTLYLTQTPDSCMHNNTLSWTAFVDLIPEVGHYILYRSVNGGPFTKLAQTNSKTLTYVDNGLTTPANYCYFVQVVDSTKPKVTASSNIICYRVFTYPLPKFSYLRTATVAANSYITVEAYVDTTPHAAYYILQRATSTAGPFVNAGKTSSISPYISFNDMAVDPNQQSYVYQVIAQNQCGYDMDTTQMGVTMYLTATAEDNGINILTWNDYSQWQKGDSVYNIYRNEDGGGFTQVATVKYTAAGSNVFQDDITSILQGQGIFSYYIQAVEKKPNYPFIDTSISNIAEAYQNPRMYIPNVFNPKGRNNIFIPVGVFVDLQNYDFQIFDRWGQLVFETHDYTQGWNGTYGGPICPEGVYVYRIVYTSSKGEYFERKGTVTLLK